MFVGSKLNFWMTFNWSKKPFLYGALYGAIVTVASYIVGFPIGFPWAPIGVIGIAVSLYLGFRNKSTYDRYWHARLTWGKINQNSKILGTSVMAFVQGPEQEAIRKELIYRHLAWLTILRHKLRLRKPWEHVKERLDQLYAPSVSEDYHNKLNRELGQFISKEEIDSLSSSFNEATQILRIQAQRFQEIRDMGMFDDFRHMELHKILKELQIAQGRAEGIKNFPFPRQYASATVWITVVFCAFVPFGLMDIYEDEETWEMWLCPFLSGLIIWLFMLMEKIGAYSENPFEGSYNDVPITAVSRNIEIDLREMLGESHTLQPLQEEDGYLM